MPHPSISPAAAHALRSRWHSTGAGALALDSGLPASVASAAEVSAVSGTARLPSSFASVAPVLAPGLLTAFMTEAHALRQRLRRPSWMSARVLERDGRRCWWCEQPATGTASLYSRALGGRASVNNTATACPACAQRFADLDPMAEHWRNPSSRWTLTQDAQRQRALTETWQHARRALHGNSTRKSAPLENLSADAPRVAVAVLQVADGTWLTPVAKPEATWASLARLARSLGAMPCADAPDVLAMSSMAWEECAAWPLIEAGALLHRVHLDTLADAQATGGNAAGNPGGGARWDELFQGARAATRAGKGA